MANPPPATLYRDPLATLSSTAAQVPLSEERAADGKSLLNPPRDDNRLSEWYESYPEEFEESNNAFDFHVYYASAAQTEHARKLHERIRREFPEMRVYRFWDRPVGIHPNTTSSELHDHTVRATWMGPSYPLLTDVLREHEARSAPRAAAAQ
ncbi:hypothetical protein C6P46_004333 [Rhodotorula mucilaginosa]|uniref:Uncharacterized protein n=1 Tax=Rhodotorula mucilaginosa TaxID=5537 RepID=A0A9P6W829_RHOMI|nr:hypothetical protein C6P46_004333 [Rhodotorula mucilaginosa]